jgi:hypothetical protein
MATEISTVHLSHPPGLDDDILALIPIPAVNYDEDSLYQKARRQWMFEIGEMKSLCR